MVGHVICGRCIGEISRVSSTLECPMCRTKLNSNNLEAIAPNNFQQTNQLGTKVARLISYCNSVLENSSNRDHCIFSMGKHVEISKLDFRR